MICVVHSYEVVGGKDWQDTVEAGKKIFKHERETFGAQVYFMRAITGNTRRVVISAFFESQGAHEEYVKKLGENTERQELMKGVKWECVVPASWRTNYYNVIE